MIKLVSRDLLDTRVEDLELSARTANCLYQSLLRPILRVGDLIIGFPARKPLPLGRGGSAASVLVFYVPFDNFEWCSSARNGTVRRGPEMFSPELLGDFGQGCRSEHPGRDAL